MENRVKEFVSAMQAKIDLHYAKHCYQYDFVAQEGSRYIKLVTQNRDKNIRGASAWGFIDKTNGDILKAASWRAPAKGFRANLSESDLGLSNCGVYGPGNIRK